MVEGVEAANAYSGKGGPYNFSKACYTTNGDIYVKWNMTADTLDPSLQTSVAGDRCAVSEDGGKTWRRATSSDIPVSDVRLSDGSYFAFFNGASTYDPAWLSNYQKQTVDEEWSSFDVYFAEDIDEFSTAVTFNKVNASTGVSTQVNATFHWPYMPMAVSGDKTVIPFAYIVSLGNYHSVIEKDGALYLCIYSPGFDSSASSCEEAVMKYSEYYSTYIFKSTDDGANWYYLSQISVDDTIYNARNIWNTAFEGFCEPMMEVMPDGSVVMLMRTGQNQPSYLVRSTDNCKTWSTPVKFDDVGVLPQILTLGCGVTLATYGRPGLFYKSTGDAQGLIWKEATEIILTNPTASMPSCYYTYLLPLSDTTALLVYTDCYYPNADGEARRTVLARVISVLPADE